MVVALSDFKSWIGDSDSDNDVMLMACLVDAKTLVDKYNKVYDAVTGDYIESSAPEELVERCYLIVAADLFERRNAPNGVANQQYASVDGIGNAPVRLARDPMAGVYPVLRKWVGFL